MKKIIFFQLLLLFTFALSPVNAQVAEQSAIEEAIPSGEEYLSGALESETNTSLTGIKLPSIFDVIVRFVIALVILLVLIFGISLFYKKFFNVPLVGNEFNAIKVLEHRYLEPKRSLYLIEVAGLFYLLSASGEQMTLISEIQGEEHIAILKNRLEVKSENYQDNDFKKILSGFATDVGGEQESKSTNVSLGLNFIKDKVNKIKKIINEN